MSDERKPMANIPPFGLRMQPDLKFRVEQAAAANNRSLNSEIVDRLERSFEYARLIDDYRQAEEKLFAQTKTERELRHQIQLLEEQIGMLKAGEAEIDLASPAVQDAMIERMQEVMGSVVAGMREEQRIANGMPLLLKWFDQNPEERAEYDALSDDEQDEFVREKSLNLWIEHLNQKRLARPNRKPTVKIAPPQVDELAKPQPKRTQSRRVANDDPGPGVHGTIPKSDEAAPALPTDSEKPVLSNEEGRGKK